MTIAKISRRNLQDFVAHMFFRTAGYIPLFNQLNARTPNDN